MRWLVRPKAASDARLVMGWWFINLYYGLSAALCLTAALAWSWVGWLAAAWIVFVGPAIGIWLTKQAEASS